MATVRVLLVDDYEPWRQFVCRVLQKRPDLEIVGEVADGLEAVQQAGELHPDVILLDIGLPTLNGIEAARRLRRISPDSKILFCQSRIFCRCGARSAEHRGTRLRCEGERERSTECDERRSCGIRSLSLSVV
jgi:CheY-like chemotaxis protein